MKTATAGLSKGANPPAQIFLGVDCHDQHQHSKNGRFILVEDTPPTVSPIAVKLESTCVLLWGSIFVDLLNFIVTPWLWKLDSGKKNQRTCNVVLKYSSSYHKL